MEEYEFVIDYPTMNNLKAEFVAISKTLQTDYQCDTGSSLSREDLAAAACICLAFRAYKKKKKKK